MLRLWKFLRIRNPCGPIDLVQMFVHKKSLILFLAKNAKTTKAIVRQKSRFWLKNRITIFSVLYMKSNTLIQNLQRFLHSGQYLSILWRFWSLKWPKNKEILIWVQKYLRIPFLRVRFTYCTWKIAILFFGQKRDFCLTIALTFFAFLAKKWNCVFSCALGKSDP
jgi:hypothetical protein